MENELESFSPIDAMYIQILLEKNFQLTVKNLELKKKKQDLVDGKCVHKDEEKEGVIILDT